ncbi:subtilisin sub11 [Cystoisospora suis]|uniref:subtilisin n=1 Tax=Cystoisospora suis TaxID=483139 RepID=A0A2C6LEQ7_9APIC|nr:subtilisin sub11 [Cystoisospora suis]
MPRLHGSMSGVLERQLPDPRVFTGWSSLTSFPPCSPQTFMPGEQAGTGPAISPAQCSRRQLTRGKLWKLTVGPPPHRRTLLVLLLLTSFAFAAAHGIVGPLRGGGQRQPDEWEDNEDGAAADNLRPPLPEADAPRFDTAAVDSKPDFRPRELDLNSKTISGDAKNYPPAADDAGNGGSGDSNHLSDEALEGASAGALPTPNFGSVVGGLSEHLPSFPLVNARNDKKRAEENRLCVMGSSGNCTGAPTPTEMLGFLNEGTEWILTPTATVLQSIGKTVDKVFRGFVLRNARVLPNYRRNVIISYRDFKPFMLLEMLAQRNRFLQQLSTFFSSLQPIRSIYLRNLGMEIFELPDLLGLGEFMKAALGLRQYVDHVFEDQEVTDFDDELRSAESVPQTGDNNESSSTGRKQETLGQDDCSLFGPSGAQPNVVAHEECLRRTQEQEKKEEGAPSRRLQVMPNDPFTWKQWPFSDSGPSRWGTEAPRAWELWTGATLKEKVTVAVIDSGVDYNHPDLRNMIWRNTDEICNNGIDDDRNGLVDDCLGWDFINGDNDPDDDNGHGTASAGIIAAEPNNHIGMAGICWGCNIMILKALNKDIKGTVSSFARAIDYALGKGVKISNNSYGGRGSGFQGLQQAVERARAAGMIFVAAAGNYNGNNDNDKDPVFPASYPLDNIISVAAITRAGSLASFSSYGRSQVDIAAPGAQIMSASLSGTYRTVEGTSFAVPFVTGAVALVWSRFPHLHYREIIDRILRNTKHNPQLQGYIATAGVLDVWKALTNGGSSLPAEPSPPLYNGGLDCSDLHCHPVATCVATPGGRKCQCPQGYQGNGYDCRDIDECSFSPCGPASVCRNLPGSFECLCREGFRQVNDSCVDIDECRESFGGVPAGRACPVQAVCQNFSGSYDCVCPPGSVWNAKAGYQAQCLTLNTPPTGPCVNNGGCGINALCQSSGAVWYYQRTCVCLNGYEKLPTPPGPQAQMGVLGDGREVCVREGILESEVGRYLAIMQSFVLRATLKTSEAAPTPSGQSISTSSSSPGSAEIPPGWLWPRTTGQTPSQNNPATSCFLGICLLGGPDASSQ